MLGYYTFVGVNLVTWRSKKQSVPNLVPKHNLELRLMDCVKYYG
jgi:hypothetical protein